MQTNRKAIVDHYKGGRKGGWFVYLSKPKKSGYPDAYVDEHGWVHGNALSCYYNTEEEAKLAAAKYNGDSFESYWNTNVESIKEVFRNAFNAGRNMGS